MCRGTLVKRLEIKRKENNQGGIDLGHHIHMALHCLILLFLYLPRRGVSTRPCPPDSGVQPQLAGLDCLPETKSHLHPSPHGLSTPVFPSKMPTGNHSRVSVLLVPGDGSRGLGKHAWHAAMGWTIVSELHGIKAQTTTDPLGNISALGDDYLPRYLNTKRRLRRAFSIVSSFLTRSLLTVS